MVCCLKRDMHRRRTAFCFAVINRFNIVAGGVQDKRGVITGMVNCSARVS
jgi:hypothetical protein